MKSSGCFALYIYWFTYVNRCIATPVIEARACNLWDLGSSPSGTLLIFFIFFCFVTFVFCRRWASLGLTCFFLFLVANPPFHLYTLGPILFYFLIFFLFIFLIIFIILKNHKKIDFHFNLVYFIFLTKNILFNYTLFIFIN